MGLKGASLAGKISAKLCAVHEYNLLHINVEVYISVE
jgi:hypothetical protein